MKFIDEVLLETKWLRFLTRYYTGKNGDVLSWDFVERINDSKAVMIVAKTKETESYLVVKQFRAPFNDYIHEFPAGLIDRNETVGQAALRELEEETGYSGTIIKTGCPLATSPGLTSETIYIVHVECDEEPKTHVRHEAAEDIEVIKLNPSEIHSFLMNTSGILSAKMYSILSSQDNNVPT